MRSNVKGLFRESDFEQVSSLLIVPAFGAATRKALVEDTKK
jgi:hypothetical protein